MGYRSGDKLGRLPLPLGEGWGEGLRSLDKPRTPSPQLSPQPKSDISDFGQSKVPNSGKPEFGWGEGAHRDYCAVIESHSAVPPSAAAGRLSVYAGCFARCANNSALTRSGAWSAAK